VTWPRPPGSLPARISATSTMRAGDAATGHQFAGEDEERHRQEGEGVDFAEKMLGQGHQEALKPAQPERAMAAVPRT